MRLCKILLEIQRDTSHIVEVPRYEVAVRRAVNPPGTKFKIHTRAVAELSDDSFVDHKNWKAAWADLRSRFGNRVQEVYDAVTFQDEYEATLERDGEDVVRNPADLIHSQWQPLMKIGGVDEAMAQAMFADGLQSVNAVAAAARDQLEALPGSGIGIAKDIQLNARELCDYSAPELAKEDDVDSEDSIQLSMPTDPFAVPSDD